MMSSRDKLRQRDHAIQAIQPALWILFAAVPFFAWFLPLSEGHRLIIALGWRYFHWYSCSFSTVGLFRALALVLG